MTEQHSTVSSSPVPREPVMRVRATVAYDGSHFHGFAENAGVRTVAGDLISALTEWLRVPERVAMTCAGRTDRGVHALAQVVGFDVPVGTPLDELALRVNRRLAPAISVRDVHRVADDFDARFHATSRTYAYRIWNRIEPNPFMIGRAWHVEEPLSLAALRLACDPFIGLHDFSSFCRVATNRDGEKLTLMRRIHSARWTQHDDGVFTLRIEAKSFCHQMVRSVVGTMVDVGLGRHHAGEIMGMFAARDRHAAGTVAPPDGLYLVGVTYDENVIAPHDVR